MSFFRDSYCKTDLWFLARDAFVKTNRRAIVRCGAIDTFVPLSIWDGLALWSYGAR